MGQAVASQLRVASRQPNQTPMIISALVPLSEDDPKS